MKVVDRHNIIIKKQQILLKSMVALYIGMAQKQNGGPM